MKYNGFPLKLKEDVEIVKSYIIDIALSDEIGEIEYELLDGEKVILPYRNYYMDKYDEVEHKLTEIQKEIYYAIFTRNHNGYIREKYIGKMLENISYDWIMPYILESSSDYVLQIIELLYNSLENQDNIKLKEFCNLNQKRFLTCHSKMVSYWNEYHRGTKSSYFCKDYVGTMLYYKCFGYKISMEKIKSK